MNVSHETPLSMLEESTKFNDYSYALIHLFESEPKYYQFFKDELAKGRTVYLDNSLFELEEMFDHNEFAKVVTELGSINSDNFYYIIPDSLEEAKITMDSFTKFTSEFPSLPGKSMGVVQGKNLDELIECYEYMCENADMVAISFDYSYYEQLFTDTSNKYEAWMLGRQWFMNYLADGGYLDRKPIHLLGCGLPQEFKMYTDDKFKCVKSVDTSNPVVHGIKKIRYDSETGLTSKESIKLVDLFDAKIDDEQMEIINHNLSVFKSFCTRK